MSKIEITLVSGDYSEDELDHASVTLQNVLPDVVLNLSDGSIGTAYGVPVTITPRKTGKVNYEAILPPQQKPLDFIRVELGGTVIRVDAQVEELDANTRYPYDLTLERKDVRKNPLWYVAEYNVNYDGANYSWATTPNEGYYFSWKDAMNAFTTKGNANAASPNSISGYYIDSGDKFNGWHLPSQAEWWSISPGGDLTNIWTFDSSGTGTYKASNQTVVFGYNPETQAGIPEASYWKTISSTELHALRFLGTEYCSAWKYVWTGNEMTVYATLVGAIDNTSAAAASWYASHWNDVYFGNDPAIGAVFRSFGISGFSGTGSGTTADSLPASVYHWSATSQNANDAYVLVFASGFSYVDSVNDRKAYGRRIRLFRTGTKAKTTIETSSSSDLKIGDIVCSDGYIFNSNDAAYIMQEGRTPIGVIVFVNDGSNAISFFNTAGNAATEKGLGRYAVKSQGRALVMCLKNSSSAAKWRTENTPYSSVYTYSGTYSDPYLNTQTVHYQGYARTAGMNSTEYPAAYSAYNYTGLAAPTNTTGWFLPSAGQWRLIFAGLTSFKYMNQNQYWSTGTGTGASSAYTLAYLAGQINSYLSKAGVGNYDAIPTSDNFYWTSSEMTADLASSIFLYAQASMGAMINNFYRTSAYKVRPVLAF